MSDLVIELRNVSEVHPYPNNPRINEETVAVLAKSISRYGFNQPIVVDTEGVIIKGHTRFAAANVLGLTAVPVIVSTQTREVNDADRIFDNRIFDLTKWDAEAYQVEMRDVNETIMEMLGKTETSYQPMVVHEDIETEHIHEAQRAAKAEADKPEDFITITCECCGEVSYLSRQQIERMK